MTHLATRIRHEPKDRPVLRPTCWKTWSNRAAIAVRCGAAELRSLRLPQRWIGVQGLDAADLGG